MMDRPCPARRRRMALCATLLLGTALAAAPTRAQDGTWQGRAPDFDDPANWTPAAVSTWHAIFDGSGTITNVTLTAPSMLGESRFAGNKAYILTGNSILTIASATSIAAGGDANLVLNGDSDSDDATIRNLAGPIDASGHPGGEGVPIGAGIAGDPVTIQGSNAELVFNDNSHADRATITNRTGGATNLLRANGGAGGAGAAGDGGAGGSATATVGTANLVFNDDSHADGATIANGGGTSRATAGAGGTGGSTGRGGTGGDVTIGGGNANLTLNDNAHLSGATITNHGGDAIATAGNGGKGGSGGGDGGDGGDATATGATATMTLNGNSTLGAGTRIDNLSGFATAVGGNGGNGGIGDGGNGGGARATGGAAILTFNDNSSAGEAVITNQVQSGSASGGNGGNGATGHGGNGGGADVRGGAAIINFNGHSTAGSATITNNMQVAPSLAVGGSGTGRGGSGSLDVGIAFDHPVIYFNDHATGGNAHIILKEGALIFNDNSVFGTAAGGGAVIDDFDPSASTSFFDNASLGNGTLNLSRFIVNRFFDNSTAGTGTINVGNTSEVDFNGMASAGTATINNNGVTRFNDTSDASNARIFNSGRIIAFTTVPLGIGSLSGSGIVDDDRGLNVGNLGLTETFGGVIRSFGALTKVGNGTLILTGANTYTGGTTVSGGTLQLGDGGATGSVVGDIVDNANVTFNRSDDLIYSNLISGTGSVTQAGPGTLIVAADQSYKGGTMVNGGTLQIGTGTQGSIVGDILDNAILVFDRDDDVAFAGDISGTGSLVKAGGGTLILTGTNSFTGGSTITDTELLIGNGGTGGTIAGNIVTSNANLTFNRSDATAFAGVISGNGSLTKAGSGTLVLTCLNSYTGATSVNAGTLELNGRITSNATVAATASLRGTGTITANLVNNGALSPGNAANPTGALTVGGNFTSAAGSLFVPTLAATGTSSQLQAGTIVLNGGTVRPTLLPGGILPMQTDFHIALGSGGLSGAFAGIDRSLLPAGFDPSLVYSGSEALLRLRRNATNFALAAGLTPNQQATAAAFDLAVANGNAAAFTTYVDIYNRLLTATPAAALLDTLSGDALTSIQVAVQGAAERFGDRLEDHTWSNSSNLWGLIAYGDQKVDSDGNGPGFTASGAELQVGFAISLGEHGTRLGLSVGMSNGDTNADARAASADIDSWSVGARLRQDFDHFYIAGQLSYSWHQIDTRRALPPSGAATASFDAHSWAGSAEAGLSARTGPISIEPFASYRYAGTSQEAFSEAGPAGALDVAAAHYESSRIGLGLRVADRDQASTVRPSAMIHYERETGNRQAALDNDLPGLGGFRIVGTELGRDIFTARLGLEIQLARNISLFASGSGRWRGNEHNLQTDGGVRLRF